MLKDKKLLLKKISIVLVILVAAAGIGIGIYVSSANTLNEDSYTVLKKGQNITSISVKGTIEGENSAEVYSYVNSILKTVNVKLGDSVKAGDVLAEIDSRDIDASIAELEEKIKTSNTVNKAALDKAKAVYDNALELSIEGNNAEIEEAQKNVDAAGLDLENKQYLYEAYTALYESDAISKQEYESYRINYENAKRTYDSFLTTLDNLKKQAALNLAQAKEDYNSAKATYENQTDVKNLESQKQKLNACIITAPISGVITEMNADVGGSSYSNLFKIEDSRTLKAIVSVKEADIAKIKVGQKAEIKTDSTGSTVISGEVCKISEKSKDDEDRILDLKSESDDEDAEYDVTLKIDNSNDGLKIGMNVNADIILEKNNDAYVVPSESIVKDMDGNDTLYIAEKENGSYIVKQIKVTLGNKSDLNVEVSGNEIKDSVIVLNNPIDYEIGSKVKIKK